ncbi:MAG: GIY-YIG nuclease family protein [Alphaproteobacteria bacterium]|nr:GIY-YIG nuclease family protein [Alphaproteobacteria bacterium]MBV9861829.1 GIY-YIG nuclease family protein [Alphaproteobacteria bacterium]
MGTFVYMLLCADGSYYVGTTRDSLDGRVAEHQSGALGGYTASRRPVELVFWQDFQNATDAIAAERQIKGWRREKKEALIRGDYALLPELARRAAGATVRPSRRALPGAPQSPTRNESRSVRLLRDGG